VQTKKEQGNIKANEMRVIQNANKMITAAKTSVFNHGHNVINM